MLMTRGGLFLHGVGMMWLFLPAVVVGTCKSLLMLDKAARKNLARLSGKEDGDCLGGVYSVKMWVLVAMMMGLGVFLGVPVSPANGSAVSMWPLAGHCFSPAGSCGNGSSVIPSEGRGT